MQIVELIVAVGMWIISGYSLDKIHMKAGFKDTPKFIFWIPGLNLLFLVNLAFAEWPAYPQQKKIN